MKEELDLEFQFPSECGTSSGYVMTGQSNSPQGRRENLRIIRKSLDMSEKARHLCGVMPPNPNYSIDLQRKYFFNLPLNCEVIVITLYTNISRHLLASQLGLDRICTAHLIYIYIYINISSNSNTR